MLINWRTCCQSFTVKWVLVVNIKEIPILYVSIRHTFYFYFILLTFLCHQHYWLWVTKLLPLDFASAMKRLTENEITSSKVTQHSWIVNVMLFFFLFSIYILFLRSFHVCLRYWQKKFQLITYIPTPYEFFKPLYHDNGGNFKVKRKQNRL